ncbi:MAG: hypothetical protein LBQ05_00510, partial [Christensenellaceae bacterium]|nr:hypothetical protein [Christensenellaceae bacterium]
EGNTDAENNEYSECAGAIGQDILLATYLITATPVSIDDITIQIDNRYEDLITTLGTNDGAVGLYEFVYANSGGTVSFVVDKKNIYGTNGGALIENTDDPTDKSLYYPKIAIPNPTFVFPPNIKPAEIDDITFDIKVSYQSSSSAKYLIDTTLDDTETEIEEKFDTYKKIGENGDYYAFQPIGKYTAIRDTDDKVTGVVENFGQIADANRVYTITYTMHYAGTTKDYTFSVTVGDLAKTTMSVGDIAKRTNDDGTVVDTDPLVYSYSDDMDVIILDLKKLKIDDNGSKPFLDYIDEWILDNYKGVDTDRPNNILALEQDGYYVNGELTADGKAYSRELFLAENLKIYITINSSVPFACNAQYDDVAYLGDDYRKKLDNYMAEETYDAPYMDDVYHDNWREDREYIYAFKPSMAGTYKVNFYLYDKFSGQNTISTSIQASVSISVVAPDTDSSDIKNNTRVIWGWILIVLSSGLLIGVVFYFIKTGHDTKFGGVPTPEKVSKPKKADTKKDKADDEDNETDGKDEKPTKESKSKEVNGGNSTDEKPAKEEK